MQENLTCSFWGFVLYYVQEVSDVTWNLEEAVAYYKSLGAPKDQSALIALLREIQKENGGISKGDLGKVCNMLEIKTGVMLALIKRIPSLRLTDRQTLELCAGPNCGKNRALADFAEKVAKASGGRIELKFVPCMRMCGKGPNIRWNGMTYHGVTIELLEELISLDGNP